MTKTVDGVKTEYTYNSNNQLTKEVSPNSTTVYTYDRNGNVRMLTDSEGAVSDTYDYDAFGTATAEAGLTINPYRYCGEYQDETTGRY